MQAMDLTSRVALVTGGASGIGRATAELFAEQGAEVAVVDVQWAPHATLHLEADLSDPASGRRVATEVVERFGRLDIVANCAGIFPHHDTLSVSAEEWSKVLDLNLNGTFMVSQACAPFLQADGGGAIVNVASRAALQPTSGMAAYAASKGGVVSLTRALALDLSPSVRVNAVAPGPITDTAGAQRATATLRAEGVYEDDPMAAFAATLPLQRTGKAIEVAQAICFLASDAASFITGSILHIDGGRGLV